MPTRSFTTCVYQTGAGTVIGERRERNNCGKREEEVGATALQEEVICRGLQIIGLAEWRQQQDRGLQPVMQWVEAQQRPPWEAVSRFSATTKRLWSKFGALRLCQGVLQRAWSEPASGEERWQMVVLNGL